MPEEDKDIFQGKVYSPDHLHNGAWKYRIKPDPPNNTELHRITLHKYRII